MSDMDNFIKNRYVNIPSAILGKDYKDRGSYISSGQFKYKICCIVLVLYEKKYINAVSEAMGLIDELVMLYSTSVNGFGLKMIETIFKREIVVEDKKDENKED